MEIHNTTLPKSGELVIRALRGPDLPAFQDVINELPLTERGHLHHSCAGCCRTLRNLAAIGARSDGRPCLLGIQLYRIEPRRVVLTWQSVRFTPNQPLPLQLIDIVWGGLIEGLQTMVACNAWRSIRTTLPAESNIAREAFVRRGFQLLGVMRDLESKAVEHIYEFTPGAVPTAHARPIARLVHHGQAQAQVQFVTTAT